MRLCLECPQRLYSLSKGRTLLVSSLEWIGESMANCFADRAKILSDACEVSLFFVKPTKFKTAGADLPNAANNAITHQKSRLFR